MIRRNRNYPVNKAGGGARGKLFWKEFCLHYPLFVEVYDLLIQILFYGEEDSLRILKKLGLHHPANI